MRVSPPGPAAPESDKLRLAMSLGGGGGGAQIHKPPPLHLCATPHVSSVPLTTLTCRWIICIFIIPQQDSALNA